MADFPPIQAKMYFDLFSDLLEKLSYAGLMELHGALTVELQRREQEREMVEGMK